MSGHSHWKQIKHQKGAADQKRGALFSKLLKAVAVAARPDPNPGFNPRLRTAVEKARAANVPSENIERAIKKSSEGKGFEELVVEAYGPGGAALIIDAVTDNANRTLAELKRIFAEGGAKLAAPGSVLWSFTKTDAGGWQPNFLTPLRGEEKEKFQKLREALAEHDDVERVSTNAEL